MNLTGEKETNSHNVDGGDSPEIMLTHSFRRIGRPELVDRKLIKCPHCTEQLMDIDRHAIVHIYRVSSGKRRQWAKMPGMLFMICKACKSEVGYIME